MFQLRLSSKANDDSADWEKEEAKRQGWSPKSTDTNFGLGPVIRIGVGYRF